MKTLKNIFLVKIFFLFLIPLSHAEEAPLLKTSLQCVQASYDLLHWTPGFGTLPQSEHFLFWMDKGLNHLYLMTEKKGFKFPLPRNILKRRSFQITVPELNSGRPFFITVEAEKPRVRMSLVHLDPKISTEGPNPIKLELLSKSETLSPTSTDLFQELTHYLVDTIEMLHFYHSTGKVWEGRIGPRRIHPKAYGASDYLKILDLCRKIPLPEVQKAVNNERPKFLREEIEKQL